VSRLTASAARWCRLALCAERGTGPPHSWSAGKGAYFGYRDQARTVEGLDSFPFYPQSCDHVPYLCVGKLLPRTGPDLSTIATINPITVAAILECRRQLSVISSALPRHGEVLHDVVMIRGGPAAEYAPVRAIAVCCLIWSRCWKTGPNSSFVKPYVDSDVPPLSGPADPFDALEVRRTRLQPVKDPSSPLRTQRPIRVDWTCH